MAKLLHAVICESVQINEETGNVTLNNLIHGLQFYKKDKPEGGSESSTASEASTNADGWLFDILMTWYRDDVNTAEETDIRLEFRDPDNKRLLQDLDMKVSLIEENMTARVTKISNKVPLRESGTYHIIIKKKSALEEKYKKVADIPFEIEIFNQ